MYKAPRGTSDILPQEQGYWRYIEQRAACLCQLYGYERIDTPVFEEAGLFVRTIGSGTDIVETPTLGTEINTDYILGIGKCEGHISLLLNIARVFPSEELADIREAA